MSENVIRRNSLGMRSTIMHEGRALFVGDQTIVVPTDLIMITCNYPDCEHKLWIWEFPICHQCIEKLEKEYPPILPRSHVYDD